MDWAPFAIGVEDRSKWVVQIAPAAGCRLEGAPSHFVNIFSASRQAIMKVSTGHTFVGPRFCKRAFAIGHSARVKFAAQPNAWGIIPVVSEQPQVGEYAGKFGWGLTFVFSKVCSDGAREEVVRNVQVDERHAAFVGCHLPNPARNRAGKFVPVQVQSVQVCIHFVFSP